MELCDGSQIGDYVIIDLIGSGGAGTVYRVRHNLTDRIEAIKILHLGADLADQQTERFRREIKVQASLQHPNIASVYNAQRIDGRLVMVMEYVDGRDLGKLIEDGSLSMTTILDVTTQALGALEYAHGRNLIHRDIKPENILVKADGTVKLTDFGLVKLGHHTELTRTSAPMGSVWYIAPEQVKAEREIDLRADLYSLGAVLYELVTGQPPFPGNNFYELMRAHVEQEPCPPIGIANHIPERLDAAIMKALEKDPDLRFGSAAEFRRELDSIAAQWVLPPLKETQTPLPPPPVKEPAGPAWWRLPAMVAASVLLLLLTGIGSWRAWLDRPPLQLEFPSTTAAIRPPESAYWKAPPGGLDALLPEAPKPEPRRRVARRPAPAPAPPAVEASAPEPAVEEPAAPSPSPVVVADVPAPPPPEPALNLLTRLAAGTRNRQLSFSPSGRRLLAVGDHSVVVWHTGSGKVAFETGESADALTVASVGPTDERLFTGDQNGAVRVWSLASGKELSTLGHKSGVTAIAVGDAGSTLVVSLQDRSIHFWQSAGSAGLYRRASRPVKRKTNAPRAIAYSGKTSSVATAANDRQIQIWARGKGKPSRIESGIAGFSDLMLSPDGVLVAAAGPSGVGVWHVVSRRRVATLQTGAERHAVSFPPNRRCVAAAGGGRTVRVWDVASSTPLVEVLTESVIADVSLTHDARRVAALDQAGNVYVWQMNQEAADLLREPFTSEEIANRIKNQPAAKPEKRGVLGRIKGFVQ